MKKALLHIFFFSLLLFNAGCTYATALPHDAMKSNTTQKVVKENVDNAHSENDSVLQKDYVLTDLDDSEEHDFDDHKTSITCRDYFTSSVFLKNTALTADFKSRPFCDKIYYHVNFSRLPRYNYISLRVLRI